MGIFDFLKKSTPPPGAGPTFDRKVAGPAKIAGDKRAQTYDRMEAIQALVSMKSADAAAALIRRFSFSIDPSITDQEEKDLAFQGILDAVRIELPKDGAEREAALDDLEKRREQVLEGLRAFCTRAEQLTWPLKVFRELLGDDEFGEELLELLDKFDTEYVRNVEPKIQVIAALEEIHTEDVRLAVEAFLEDQNETVRFHAVETTFAQNDTASIEPLLKILPPEESVRVKNKVAEGLLQRGWVVPKELREETTQALRDSEIYSLGSDGKIVKRAGYG